MIDSGFDVRIVGAGIIGTSVARDSSKPGLRTTMVGAGRLFVDQLLVRPSKISVKPYLSRRGVGATGDRQSYPQRSKPVS